VDVGDGVRVGVWVGVEVGIGVELGVTGAQLTVSAATIHSKRTLSRMAIIL
jgi:hypothetical protein